jgi:hypothetical protein
MTFDPRAASSQRPNTPIGQYALELFYRVPPAWSGDSLLAALRRRCPDIAVSPVAAPPSSFVFVHRDHPAEHGGGRVAVQSAIVSAAQPLGLARREASLAQSWGWPRAAEAAADCAASVLVTDVLATELHYLERLVLLENVLVALLEAYPAAAIHWQPTQQLVDPQEFLAAYRSAGGMVFMPGPINVRMFQAEATSASDGEPLEVLMDTLGLAALGFADLQCRFRGLDPQAVSRVLYNTALYVLERGGAIDDEHTVPGIEPQSRWLCRRCDSLALPAREVLDLTPQTDPTSGAAA